MKKIFFLVSLLITCLLTSISYAQTEDNIIYWPYFSYPTLFIIEDENQLSGSGISIQDYLIQNMPEFNHKRISASPKRMFENLKHGAQYCVVGALKTPDREKFMLYSDPCRVSFYPMLVIRPNDKNISISDNQVSIKHLLDNDHLVFGEIAGIRYGKEINQLLEHYKNKENVKHIETVSGPDALVQLMRMLVNKRVDYFIAEPTTIQYFLKKEPDLSHKLTFVRMKEQSQVAAAGYVTCPKNEWGKKIIDKLNIILRRVVKTDEFYSLALPWIQQDLLDEYETQYRRLLLNNE